MSSPRRPLESDAYVADEKPRGPIAMPMKSPEEFLHQFNRVYQTIGLRIEQTVRHPPSHDDRLIGDDMIEI